MDPNRKAGWTAPCAGPCGGRVSLGRNTNPAGKAICNDCIRHAIDPDMMCALCETCAQPLYYARPWARYCSERCKGWWKGRSPSRRRVNSMRSAAKRGQSTPPESFDPNEVFARDKWRCQQCAKRTPRSACVPHPDAPTLDHIVPLSQGGEHTRANTQLLCFMCNCTKGNRAGGEQLRLIG